MYKKSKAAVFLRNSKVVYGTYLNVASALKRQDTSQLKYFLMFVGYPRSGSSILGSLLDAHENIIISHELNVLKYIQEGFNRNQIFHLIEKNSRLFNKSGRKSSGYPGILTNQFNAMAHPLKIIGDKKAGTSSALLGLNPALLQRLEKTVNVPVKCIHIVRNPFDMITTQAYGGNEKQLPLTQNSISKAIEFCFTKANAVDTLIQKEPRNIYTLKHEDLLSDSRVELLKLAKWLELEFREDYLNECNKILFPNPNKSRKKYYWSDEEKELVQSQIDKIKFFKGYTFDN